MPKKPKFRPVVTRVELNPEQAVLECNCMSDPVYGGQYWNESSSCWTPYEKFTAIGMCVEPVWYAATS
ncbi:MAG: hypothetical protein V2A66_01390 [Pseudomonadota bacterium]